MENVCCFLLSLNSEGMPTTKRTKRSSSRQSSLFAALNVYLHNCSYNWRKDIIRLFFARTGLTAFIAYHINDQKCMFLSRLPHRTRFTTSSSTCSQCCNEWRANESKIRQCPHQSIIFKVVRSFRNTYIYTSLNEKILRFTHFICFGRVRREQRHYYRWCEYYANQVRNISWFRFDCRNIRDIHPYPCTRI